jgi:hypothetical protein
MIVITADHGQHTLLPLLLVKEWDRHAPFSRSDAPVSLADVNPTILQAASGQKQWPTIYSWAEGVTRARPLLAYTWEDKDHRESYLPPITKIYLWATNGEIHSYADESIVYSGINDLNTNYELGNMILFNSASDYLKYVDYGICLPEGDFAWTLGNVAEMRLDLNDIPHKNQKLIFALKAIFNGRQRFRLYVNNNFVGEQVIEGNAEKIEFDIPRACFSGTGVQLRFEFPDALCPKEINPDSTDDRVLAFAFTSLMMEPAE